MKRERLTSERNKKKKTQLQVAQELEISEIYVRKLESGTVKPGRDTMLRFEIYYKVNARKLFPDIFLPSDDKKFIKDELRQANDEQAATFESLQHLSVAYTV